LSKSFGDKVLFEDLNITLERGKRLGMMGPNGVGKTTLLKILLGEEEPTSGVVKQGALVEYGYLDQHLKMLDEDKSIIRAVWPEPDPEITDQKMKDLLARFGLAGKIVDQPIRECSGGERSRAALARLVVQGANVLILDEPTNHLDIWACDALEEAIKEFDGTVIVVSHDRYFLNRIAELLIVMEPGRVELVYGNYDTYELLRAARENAAAEEAARKAKHQPAPKKQEAVASAPSKSGKKKRKFPYRKVADLENDIAAQETLVAELEASLATEAVYRDANKFSDTMKAHLEGKEKLAKLYEHWEEAVELNNG
jgi:ATP-binding cassette subfamily F protein 3